MVAIEWYHILGDAQYKWMEWSLFLFKTLINRHFYVSLSNET